MDKHGEIAGGFHKLITFDIDAGARRGALVLCDGCDKWVLVRGTPGTRTGVVRDSVQPETLLNATFEANGESDIVIGKSGSSGGAAGGRGLPDTDAGVMGHAAGHRGLGAFDDALVLRRFGDAGARCGHRWLHTDTHTHIPNTHTHTHRYTHTGSSVQPVTYFFMLLERFVALI